jgi:hypothetical protein
MIIRWSRAVVASVLFVGCLTLAFVSPGAASASTKATDASSALIWSEPLGTGLTPPAYGPVAVSCPAKKFCVALADNYASTYNGKKWSAEVNTSENLVSVSCASTTFCVAVDELGGAETFNGKKWSIPETVAPGVTLVSVSCASASFCAAVAYGGDAITYDGKQWSAPAAIDSGSYPDEPVSVSCASSTFCAAVDEGGRAMLYNGSTWSAPVVIDSTPLSTVDAVSCPSSTFCAAVDSAGNIIGYNGTTWAAPVTIDAGNDLTSVSCTSSTFCISVDNDTYTNGQYDGGPGNIVQTPGAAPGTVQPIDTSDPDVSSVSCATATFCVATDSFADYMVSSSEPAQIARTGNAARA